MRAGAPRRVLSLVALVAAVGTTVVVGIYLRGEPPREDGCASHQTVLGTPALKPGDWLLGSRRSSFERRSSDELFALEPRHVVWAEAMEHEIRSLIEPEITKLDGLRLGALCCHRTACRLVLHLTRDLKERLNTEARRQGQETIFAAAKILGEAGPIGRGRWDNPDTPEWRKRARFFGLGIIPDVTVFWRMERKLREEIIIYFDEKTHDPAALAGSVQQIRAKMRSRLEEKPKDGG